MNFLLKLQSLKETLRKRHIIDNKIIDLWWKSDKRISVETSFLGHFSPSPE